MPVDDVGAAVLPAVRAATGLGEVRVADGQVPVDVVEPGGVVDGPARLGGHRRDQGERAEDHGGENG